MSTSHSEYLRYYQAQQGGALPVFRGGMGTQRGGGLIEDLFRGLAIVGLAIPTAIAFNNAVNQAKEKEQQPKW
jgi:hypothetical protein